MAVYWRDKQEKLCVDLTHSGNSQIQISRIFYALQPALNEMFDSISQRYFTISNQSKVDLKPEAVDFVFMKIITHYQPQRQKAFTFCGTVMRNRIHEVIVREPNTKKSLQITYTDEILVFDFKQPIDYGERPENDIKPVLDRLERLKKQLMVEYENEKISRRKLRYVPIESKLRGKIKVVELVKEYISRFPDSEDSFGLIDFIHVNTNYKKTSLGYLMGDLFGVQTRGSADDEVQSGDTKWNYLDDDYCPNENIDSKRYQKKKINKL